MHAVKANKTPPPGTNAAGGHKDKEGHGGKGYSPADHLKRLGPLGACIKVKIAREHSFVLDAQQTFDEFLKPESGPKNRYANLILLDETRVILEDELVTNRGDYVHASYVDGYDRKCQYILAQAPYTVDTEIDFWRMVWQEQPSCIVLVSPLVSEENVMLARNFWPHTNKDRTYLNGQFKVTTEQGTFGAECDYYTLSVHRQSVKEPFSTKLLHYRQWDKDEQVPATLAGFTAKARFIAQRQEQALAPTQPAGVVPPMLVMCATGAHRAGTFTALDILLRRMQDRRRVAMKETVTQLRRERFGCVHLERHYAYLSDAVVNYALESNYVDMSQLPNATDCVAGLFTKP